MVETERPHRSSRRRSTSEFFLCFSSRSTAASSSSSMKISSKSILSPGRSRESSMSLSSSLSRRLRSNGSMKGGQASPMFPTGSKKKGSGGSFEPPEPSSPKVTCIGQVRVKSKKKHGRKQLRTRSQRRGEVSFRKTEQTTQDGIGNGIGIHHPQPQQRWVHLSLSICETLRAFGAEFNCFVPCGRSSSSSCSWSGDREKGGDKRRGGRSSNSCGAVFARWLFALQESEEKGREAVVPAREEEERIQIQIEIERREAAREIEMEVSEEEEEVKITRGDAKEEEEEEIEEEGRQSICIPPKNALLLMRSRSAPFRMSSLANRFWESPAPQDKEDNYNKFEDDDEEEESELEIHNYVSLNGEKQREAVTREAAEEDRNGSSTTTTSDCGNQTKLDAEETKEEDMVEKWSPLQGSQILSKEEMLEPQGDERGMIEQNPQIHRKDQVLDKGSSSPEAFEDSILKVGEEEEKTRVVVVVVEKKEERRVSFSSSTVYLEPESEEEEEDEEQEEIESSLEQIAEKSIEEEKENTTLETTNVSSQDPREQEEKPVLPECLLLMMCEPKLSMEVSKETWVCSNDFIRCRPSEKKKLVHKKTEQGEYAESKTKKTDTTSESKTVHSVPPQPRRHQQKKKDEFQVQPPRSSYSKVEQAMKKQSMATAVGQKLSGGSGSAYEPFVLKRCKSEPMRRTDKLSGEVCLWKKNKMESHHPPELPVGAGAAGVGF